MRSPSEIVARFSLRPDAFFFIPCEKWDEEVVIRTTDEVVVVASWRGQRFGVGWGGEGRGGEGRGGEGGGGEVLTSDTRFLASSERFPNLLSPLHCCPSGLSAAMPSSGQDHRK